MGIFIHVAISNSTTREEWADVYQETLQLVKAFPLAERRAVPIRGITTRCLVPTEERNTQWGWNGKELRSGWFADGDYESLHTAESYYLPRDLVVEEQYDKDAPDAMLNSVPNYLDGYDWFDRRFRRCYSLWGDKTQGEPYHMYLLAIACLIESRLGRKAYVYGDITRGQCERAVRMANEHLDQAIHSPDQCDMGRLLARVKDFSLSETEKLTLFIGLYLGRKDADFGKTARDHFSEQVWDEYWENRFRKYQITTVGFNYILTDYLLWGFDLEKMCSFVVFQDDDGNTHYEKFVQKIMDAKLHQRDKDCTDVLKIDPDEEEPYGIGFLLAQFTLGGARNRKIDPYIPIEEIKSALAHAIGDYCPVDELIEEYLEAENNQELPDPFGDISEEEYQKVVKQDPSYVLSEAMKCRRKTYEEMIEKYDILESEDLPYYVPGDIMRPGLRDSLGRSFAFYQEILTEDTYLELMSKTPEERCQWLARENQSILLRDKDWERIYDDIMAHPDSFARYYPMVRVQVTNEGLRSMVRALVANDALYSYASELAADPPE